jgi:hypothetical protein
MTLCTECNQGVRCHFLSNHLADLRQSQAGEKREKCGGGERTMKVRKLGKGKLRLEDKEGVLI